MEPTILDAVPGIGRVAVAAGKYLPEPASKGVGLFKDIMNSVSKSLGDDTTAHTLEISDEYRELIEKQLEVQKQMQLTAMVSNIHRSEHESKMAAVRNIRVG